MGLIDYILGRGRREFDFPETLSMPQRYADPRAQWFQTWTLSPHKNAEIEQNFNPRNQVRYDSFGNPYAVTPDGRSYYFNRPGLSGRDAIDAAALFLSLGKLMSAPAAGGAVARGLATAARGAAGSMALDLQSHLGGAEELVNPTAAVVTAASGGMSRWFTQLLAGPYQRVVRDPRLFNQARGELTQAGRRRLEQLGVPEILVRDDLAAAAANFSQTWERAPATVGAMAGRAAFSYSQRQNPQEVENLQNR